MHTLRHDKSVQDQVEARIRQLSNNDVKGADPKYKSQRGGAMDIFIKERVKWPHEFVLAGNTKDRITYNQLNITQWMSGFCRILRDENCQKIRDHMLDYLIALLDDSHDFSWQQGLDEKPTRAILQKWAILGNTGQYYFLTQIWGKTSDELYLSFIILFIQLNFLYKFFICHSIITF